MANYTTTITNEGAALLASVIANQGTLTFNEFRFSENDYTGQESTLTEGTFLGVFIAASAAASVIDLTTIKASAQFDNSTITGNHDLYSIGIIGTDGNTTALIAVCTTTDPDVIREPLTGTSTYAFNVNLSVSDTSQITVVGTTAAVIYDIDVVDNLTSPATNKPLSANQGRLVADNLAANENVYGAKNIWNIEKWLNDIGQAFTKSGDVYTTTISDARTNTNKCVFSDTDIEVTLSAELTASGSMQFYVELFDSNDNNVGSISLSNPTFTGIGCKVRFNFNNTGTVTLTAPMLRDSRVIDHTFAPFAETNLQLTNDVASIFDTLPNNAGAHNRYRGKALTIDANFWDHISDGTFEDQFVGDTITINGRTYILAHANYWLHTGDTACETNHWVVISPNMGNAQMNSDNSTAGGYLGSGFRSGTNHDSTPNTAFADALAIIKADFGASHILSHRAYLDNAVTGGYPSAGAWVDSEAELMSQIMAYGNRFFDPSTNLGATIPALYSIDKSQLALYAQRPDLLTDRSYWWLRDVVSAALFARVASDGNAACAGASASFGVRLAFGIKA